ncbi:MAG: G-D-S-L family lipolytic protein [Nostocales cyanobacterium]|nr:MAG: G-D-S-L family lipolytic protein [Nostocales cyanobacterium]TAF14097.1 MAG: G-D-S-L family lipolytic protein [Nostocales cyanobacterium]
MQEPYLLAASLLTGLAIPTSALPKMPNIRPENTDFLGNLKQRSRLPVGEKIIAKVDISLPEFSSRNFTKPENLSPAVSQKNTSLPEFSKSVLSSSETLPNQQEKSTPSLEILLAQLADDQQPKAKKTSLNSSPQTTKLIPVSGNQLYYLRLAALRNGQIYTRVDNNDLQPLSKSGNKQKLTYQDWKNLLAMEARAMAQGQGRNRLSILLGDSLTLWFPKEKLPNGKLWLNQGISGDKSTGLVGRLTAFSNTRPEVIYLMIGINDLLKGTSDQTILINYRRMIRNLRQDHPNSQIIVQSILPVRRPQVSNQRIRHLNAQIALIAKQERASYLNIHHWFTDLDGALSPELSTDGLHLSPAGYDVWRAALEQIEYIVAQR